MKRNSPLSLTFLLFGVACAEHEHDREHNQQHHWLRKPSSGHEVNKSIQDLEVDSPEYEAAKIAMATTESRRNLQMNAQSDPKLTTPMIEGVAGEFRSPCEPLPDEPDQYGWMALTPNDDSSLSTQLGFDFDFYGSVYPKGSLLWINNNGNLNFGSFGLSRFSSEGFPIDSIPMIAPFWADVDTRTIEADGTNRVWYKTTNSTLSIIWDGVGYFSRRTDKRNTFQVVISNELIDNRGNICFCYVDMNWTTGGASDGVNGFGGVPATIGLNRGSSGDFVQLGHFNQSGVEYDGGGGNNDGVDYLDGRTGGQAAFCMNVQSTNVPPVVSGFPDQGMITVGCMEVVSLKLMFASPELDQTVNITLPTKIPPNMILSLGGSPATISVSLEWTPEHHDNGTYVLEFVATDSVGDSVTKSLTIEVMSRDTATMCTPLPDTASATCPNNGPYCTPWRSPDHCPIHESFPDLIRSRRQLAVQDPDQVESLGYWFHYLEDKAAGYALTVSEGYRAPEVYCCSYGTLQDCLPIAPSSFVVRTAGHHSMKSSVFAFPKGFGNIELLSGLNMTLQDVEAALSSLSPSKILVEELITSSEGTLPMEFKFHMFDGQIGSVTVVQNRGSQCACFAEIDEDWNRLDLYGCFVPGGEEKSDGICASIDFDAGSLDPYPFKDLHNCDRIARVDDCVWQEMKEIAAALSRTIKVYARIDMFVGANNKVYVQEYTMNHNNGLRHCAAKLHDDSGCVDSCFLGRLWNSMTNSTLLGSFEFGGLPSQVPRPLINWTMMSSIAQCDATTASVSDMSKHASYCA